MFVNIAATALAEELKADHNVTLSDIVTLDQIDRLCVETCRILGLDPSANVTITQDEHNEIYGRHTRPYVTPHAKIEFGTMTGFVPLSMPPQNMSVLQYMTFRPMVRKHIAVAAACMLYVNRRDG